MYEKQTRITCFVQIQVRNSSTDECEQRDALPISSMYI
jgi:hypothetical protein